ncbi:hypothetical protein ES708_15192 [subsurface metagenome]
MNDLFFAFSHFVSSLFFLCLLDSSYSFLCVLSLNYVSFKNLRI